MIYNMTLKNQQLIFKVFKNWQRQRQKLKKDEWTVLVSLKLSRFIRKKRGEKEEREKEKTEGLIDEASACDPYHCDLIVGLLL